MPSSTAPMPPIFSQASWVTWMSVGMGGRGAGLRTEDSGLRTEDPGLGTEDLGHRSEDQDLGWGAGAEGQIDMAQVLGTEGRPAGTPRLGSRVGRWVAHRLRTWAESETDRRGRSVLVRLSEAEGAGRLPRGPGMSCCRTRRTGLEPATTGVTSQYSNQLSYRPWISPLGWRAAQCKGHGTPVKWARRERWQAPKRTPSVP